MKNIAKLTEKIGNEKEISNRIKKESYYTVEQFINDAFSYIKAIKQGRMICSIGSVSSSGMSRTIKFLSAEKNKSNFRFCNYNMLFEILGFTPVKGNDFYFRISGCGMDMIFHTNYTIIHRLARLGFISKKECANLAQQTPSVI